MSDAMGVVRPSGLVGVSLSSVQVETAIEMMKNNYELQEQGQRLWATVANDNYTSTVMAGKNQADATRQQGWGQIAGAAASGALVVGGLVKTMSTQSQISSLNEQISKVGNFKAELTNPNNINETNVATNSLKGKSNLVDIPETSGNASAASLDRTANSNTNDSAPKPAREIATKPTESADVDINKETIATKPTESADLDTNVDINEFADLQQRFQGSYDDAASIFTSSDLDTKAFATSFRNGNGDINEVVKKSEGVEAVLGQKRSQLQASASEWGGMMNGFAQAATPFFQGAFQQFAAASQVAQAQAEAIKSQTQFLLEFCKSIQDSTNQAVQTSFQSIQQMFQNLQAMAQANRA